MAERVKYRVEVRHTRTAYIDVEAQTPLEAETLALDDERLTDAKWDAGDYEPMRSFLAPTPEEEAEERLRERVGWRDLAAPRELWPSLADLFDGAKDAFFDAPTTPVEKMRARLTSLLDKFEKESDAVLDEMVGREALEGRLYALDTLERCALAWNVNPKKEAV